MRPSVTAAAVCGSLATLLLSVPTVVSAASAPLAAASEGSPRGGQAGPRARVARLAIKAMGTLPHASVRPVVLAGRKDLRACLEARLPDDPDLGDDVTADFVVTESGHTAAAFLSPRSFREAPDVRDCLAAAMERWRFPAARGTSRVALVFRLEPRRPARQPPRP